MKKIILYLGVALLVCVGGLLSGKDDTEASGGEPAEPKVENEQAKMYLQYLCLSCHQAQEGHDAQRQGLAPPMWGVRDHYLEVYPEREAFVEAVSAFLQKPELEKSLMRNAAKRFGLMPVQGLAPEQLEAVASLVYDGELFKEPPWWAAHQKAQNGKGKKKNEAAEKP